VAHDRERCSTLAAELVEAARDERRLPGQIEYSDMISAFLPIAHRLHEKGMPIHVIVAAMHDSALDFEWSGGRGPGGWSSWLIWARRVDCTTRHNLDGHHGNLAPRDSPEDQPWARLRKPTTS
jgi:hypothetical protein